MKKIQNILFAVVAMFAAVSCAKEFTAAPDAQNSTDAFTFSASLDASAKLNIQNDGTSLWTAGDVIVVYNGNNTDMAFLQEDGTFGSANVQVINVTQGMISNGGKTVTFGVNIPAPSGDYWYMYAADRVSEISAIYYFGPIAMNPSNYTDGAKVPFLCYARIAKAATTVAFDNVIGLLKFKCSDASVKKIVVETNDGTFIGRGGNVVLYGTKPTVEVNDYLAKQSYLCAVEGIGSSDIYVSLTPSTYLKGINIKAYCGDVDPENLVATAKIWKPLTIQAAHVLDLGDVIAASETCKQAWLVDGLGDIDKLYDDSVLTCWTAYSASLPDEISIDMNKVRTLTKVMISSPYGSTTGSYAKKFDLELSEDGSSWDMALHNQVLEANPYRQEFAFEATQAQYARITFTESYDATKPIQIAEIDFANDTYTSGDSGYKYPALVNASQTFAADGSNLFPAVGAGRMQRVTGWLTDSASSNIITFDGANGCMCFWSAYQWGCNNVTNGKVYQKFTLVPGSYTFIATPSHTTTDARSVEIYAVVAKGDGLPNTADLSSAIGYKRLDDGNTYPAAQSITFEITELTEVSVGVLGNTKDNYQYVPANPWTEFYFKKFEFIIN